MKPLRSLFVAAFSLMVLTAPAAAADRAKLRAFLEITGFDVAIESLQQGAMAGPGMAGSDPSDFGSEWVRLAEKIFSPEEMIDRALDMMAAVMPDDLVDHGADFYASDLGQRLVAVENASHLTPEAEKYGEAERLLAEYQRTGSPRIAWYEAMTVAIGGIDSTVRALIEVQVRYLMAAMAAGSAGIEMSEADLRGLFQAQAPAIREDVRHYSLLSSIYAYRDISDADIAAYVAALEHPKMRQVYEVLNAIQFEVMAERYEELAAALAGLSPQQDI